MNILMICKLLQLFITLLMETLLTTSQLTWKYLLINLLTFAECKLGCKPKYYYNKSQIEHDLLWVGAVMTWVSLRHSGMAFMTGA